MTVFRSNSKVLQFALFLLVAVLAGAHGAAQSSLAGPIPALRSFSPTQGMQGTTVNLTFNGTGFGGKVSLQFSPPAGLSVNDVHLVSATQISAQVQIDATAPLGPREVMLSVAGRALTAQMPFVVIAAPSPQCGTPGTAPCPGQQEPPVLSSFTPVQGTQGSSVTVTFLGARFVSPAAAQFVPGAGITVQSTTVNNTGQIQAQLVIDANAPLGARNVSLAVGKTHLTAQSTFTVVQAAGRPAGQMQILRVIPNQVPAGSQGVELTLEGTNFVPGTLVSFSAAGGPDGGIFINGASRYVNSSEMHVVVNVLPTALPGGRDIRLQTPKAEIVTGKGMLNVLAATPSKTKGGPPPKVKLTPVALQPYSKGIIKLDAPKWGDRTEGEFQTHYGIPLIDDDLRFQWHEQNPGLADYYELRLYAKDGTTLLAKKRIDGTTAMVYGHPVMLLPTYFRPDAAFLADLLAKVPRPRPVGFLYQPADFKKPIAIGAQQKSAPTGPQLSDGDMQWEVAGFHTYNKDSVVPKGDTPDKSSQTDLEVEISERWPLGAPLAPTGLACSGAGTGTGLQLTDVADKTVYDSKGKPTGGIDPNNYAGDPWVLSGNFNLSRSPYAAHPNLHQEPGSKCDGCLFGQVDLVQFDDVFLDWGDGTVQRLSSPPKDSGSMNWNRGNQLSLPPDAKSPYAVKHVYQYPGTYTVRVFQLSEADAQHVDVALVAASADGPSIHPFFQAVALSSATKAGGNVSAPTLKDRKS